MAKLSDYVAALKLLPGNADSLDIGVEPTSGISWLKLTSADGTAQYIFVSNAGDLKIHTAEPTDDTDGTVVGTQT
jgi:hypothetical protein